jgi:hypothetical protein
VVHSSGNATVDLVTILLFVAELSFVFSAVQDVACQGVWDYPGDGSLEHFLYYFKPSSIAVWGSQAVQKCGSHGLHIFIQNSTATASGVGLALVMHP